MDLGTKEQFQPSTEEVSARFRAELHRSRGIHNQMFAWILSIQWLACVLVAALISPRTWSGVQSAIHPHLVAAIFLGGVVSFFPVFLILRRHKNSSIRYVVAIAQMLMSALLIHLCGGRIEAHFHVFASLALLAFYRDSRLLCVSAAVVAADHILRGIYWPQSVFGIDEAWPVLRALEHAAWVLLEVATLAVSIRRSHKEMHGIVSRQIFLENAETFLENTVDLRTRELQESEQKAQDRFNNAVIGLYHCDAGGRLQSVNPAMAKLLGYESGNEMMEEIENLNQIECHEASPKEDWLDTVLRMRGYRHRDSFWKHRDGTSIPVRESTKVVCSKDGELLGIEGSVEDLTEFRELEQRYLQSQKVQAIGQLTTGIAHDFNTILTSIVGFSDLIISTPETPENVREQVKDIHTSAGRATRLTAQLLAFSKKQTFQPKVFQLTETLEDMDSLLRRIAGDSIRLHFNHEENAGAAYGDASQIEQVILNLAVNARDAMPDGGDLTIGVGEEVLSEGFISYCGAADPGKYVVLTVSDTGCGITEDVRERIFEPFFTTKEMAGTGLGLSTCIGIVKQSGGHLTVDSEPGRGSTFNVFLPVSKNSTEDNTSTSFSPQEASFQALRGTGTILLAEDEDMARKFGVRALTSLGYKVVEAINGADALQKFLEHDNEEKIELLLTDVMMPVMGGAELARRVSEISPDTPIIYISGYTNEVITNTDLLNRGSYFVQKPYSISLLGERIHEALNTPAA